MTGDQVARLVTAGGFRDAMLETVTRPQLIGADADADDAAGFLMSIAQDTHGVVMDGTRLAGVRASLTRPPCVDAPGTS